MEGVGFTVALGVLKALAFVYDLITFPVYFFLQRPWQNRQNARKIKVRTFDTVYTCVTLGGP